MSDTIPLDPSVVAHDKPFYGARVKVARANAHLTEVERAVAEYHDSNPYRPIQTFNPNDQSYRVTLEIDSPPPRIGLIVGDCIHNLRSALDILAVELTRLGLAREGKEMSRTKLDKAGFLIAGNRENFETKLVESTQHWSDAAKNFLRGLEPFKDGSHPLSRMLWTIHKLDILDKHKVLLTLGMTSSDHSFEWGIVGVEPGAMGGKIFSQLKLGKLIEEGRELKTGDELATYWPNGAVLEIKFGAAMSVAIEEPEIIDRTDVVGALNTMLGATDAVVEALAARG